MAESHHEAAWIHDVDTELVRAPGCVVPGLRHDAVEGHGDADSGNVLAVIRPADATVGLEAAPSALAGLKDRYRTAKVKESAGRDDRVRALRRRACWRP